MSQVIQEDTGMYEEPETTGSDQIRDQHVCKRDTD